MAKDCSFDIVSEVEMQEVDNAVNQSTKEIGQRFDFRGSKSSVNLENNEIKIVADDDMKLKNIVDILQNKLVKRGISLKNLDYGKVDSGSLGSVKQVIKIKKGIDKEAAKKVIAAIKGMKVKVQAQIMEDQVRVSAKDKDDLQQVIAELRQKDFGVELQFVNYR
ncbi:YajQ family cyclic di-GMP-binding protein [Azotosporobacter soli]|uniref:YajQ family cyclic di-GMP-binding protein n=1 Tax=Azotosporobacter soli TaxID=3055040 RepID=UPI0031FE7E62